MGVKGLWKILEPTERPISSPETLSGQKVAIDASIWLYQFIRVIPSDIGAGYSTLILAGLFKRLCKLLYFNIMPLMVFDGAAPALKKKTTKERAERRDYAEERYRRTARKMIATQMQLEMLKQRDKPSKTSTNLEKHKDDTFETLEDFEEDKEKESTFMDSDEFDESIDKEYLASLDFDGTEFSQLAIEMQQEILLAKKDHVLQQHLNLVHKDKEKMPALDFSNLQVDALVKKRKIVEQLEKVRDGLNVDYEKDYLQPKNDYGRRIASDSTKRYVLLKSKDGGWVIDGSVDKTKVVLDNDNIKESEMMATTSSPLTTPSRHKEELLDQGSDNDFLFGKTDSSPYDHINTDIDDVDYKHKRDFVIEAMIERVNKIEEKDIEMTKESKEKDDILKFDPEKYLAKPVEELSAIQIIDCTEIDEDERRVLVPKLNLEKKNFANLPLNQTDNDTFSSLKELDFDNSTRPLSSLIENVDANPTVDTDLDDDKNKDIHDDTDQKITSKEQNDGKEHELLELTQSTFVNPSNNQETAELIAKLQADVESLRDDMNPARSATLDNELLEDFRKLLTIMGVPWIIAPGEAEAQCAWLQKNRIVDAVISDDNDTLVFGASRVYRNFFANNKKVSLYIDTDMERELGLCKEKLIILAILLGSDYSIGVKGIGPVKAMKLFKILSTSPSLNDQSSTKDLLAIIRKGLFNGIWPLISNQEDAKFLEKLSIQCEIKSSSSFDEQIIEEYSNPNVNNEPGLFRWKVLSDLISLHQFLQTKLKWSNQQCKKIIDPIIARQMTFARKKQTLLDKFISPT